MRILSYRRPAVVAAAAALTETSHRTCATLCAHGCAAVVRHVLYAECVRSELPNVAQPPSLYYPRLTIASLASIIVLKSTSNSFATRVATVGDHSVRASCCASMSHIAVDFLQNIFHMQWPPASPCAQNLHFCCICFQNLVVAYVLSACVAGACFACVA